MKIKRVVCLGRHIDIDFVNQVLQVNNGDLRGMFY
jgi:hypothetical protein